MKSIRELTAAEMGHRLHGFGVNLVVKQIARSTLFLTEVLEFELLRADKDYAVLAHRDQLFQLHCDATYIQHPLLALLPESGLRGAGAEFRLYDVDPDKVETRAREFGAEILQTATDKPHGLRECFVLDSDGYCWVPSVKI